jgi:hypothetical protein
MRRRLFNVAVTVSVVLCLLTAVLWLRSLVVWDTLHIQLPERAIDVDHADGRLRLATVRHVREYPIHRHRLSHMRRKATYVENTFGPRRWWPQFVRHHVGFIVILPHWVLATLGVGVPALALYRWTRSHHRVAARRCPSCGYDLRATPDRCPECGIVPEAAA